MAAPTIASRLQRRFLVMSGDAAVVDALRVALPPDWTLVETRDLDTLGGYEEILQFRFLLLDLDACGVADPLEIVEQVRGELMLNLPVFCFGGDDDLRDAARLARADRFFERDEIVSRLSQFCEQFGWGA
jgi:hypothetical protein